MREPGIADVLARIAEHPAKRIADLLPWNWKTATPAAAHRCLNKIHNACRSWPNAYGATELATVVATNRSRYRGPLRDWRLAGPWLPL